MWRIPRVETGLPTASRLRFQVPLENTWAPRSSIPEPGRCLAALSHAPQSPSWRPLSSPIPARHLSAGTAPGALPSRAHLSSSGSSGARRLRGRDEPLTPQSGAAASARSPAKTPAPSASRRDRGGRGPRGLLGRRTPLPWLSPLARLLLGLLAAPSTRPLLCAGSLGRPSPAGLTTRASPPPLPPPAAQPSRRRPFPSLGRAREGSPAPDCSAAGPAQQRLGSVLLVSTEHHQAPGRRDRRGGERRQPGIHAKPGVRSRGRPRVPRGDRAAPPGDKRQERGGRDQLCFESPFDQDSRGLRTSVGCVHRAADQERRMR